MLKKFILYVSRIEPRKNQALLIEIWNELGLYKKKFDLVLVGSEGVKDAQFWKQMHRLSETEEKYFLWLKNISNKNLVWLYKNCSLFVFPSSAEGFGISPLEAAFYGAKVLCSNTTAMKDFDFFKEFLFSPNSKEEFKQQLLMALSNDFPHQSVKNEIQDRYNWRNIAKNFASNIFKIFNEK